MYHFSEELLEIIQQKEKEAIQQFRAEHPEYNDMHVHALTDRVKQGDIKAQEELLKLHADLIQYAVIGHWHTHKNCANKAFIEIAKIGLLNAALAFNKAEDLSFIAHAIWYMRKAIIEKFTSPHDSKN